MGSGDKDYFLRHWIGGRCWAGLVERLMARTMRQMSTMVVMGGGLVKAVVSFRTGRWFGVFPLRAPGMFRIPIS